MSCQRPSELVPPLGLILETSSSLDVLCVRVDGLMVATNSFGNGLKLHGLCFRI